MDHPRDEAEPRFGTGIYAELNRGLSGFDLSIANGRHPPALVLRRNGQVDAVAGTGPLMGVVADSTYTYERLSLESGDTLLAITVL